MRVWMLRVCIVRRFNILRNCVENIAQYWSLYAEQLQNLSESKLTKSVVKTIAFQTLGQ